METTPSRYEQTLNRIEKLRKEMGTKIENIRMLEGLEMLGARQAELLKLEDKSERLTLLTRSLPFYTGARNAMDDVVQVVKDTVPVEIGFTEEGWFCLRIPMLLPRKEHGSVSYIRGFLYPAMSAFFREQLPVRYPKCVIIYRHVYARDRPERRYRDHDNIEINAVTDIVAFYTMPDDNPTVCRHYYCSVAGDPERTEVYVVPQEDFIRWLTQEPSIPEGGVFLLENRPDSTEKTL